MVEQLYQEVHQDSLVKIYAHQKRIELKEMQLTLSVEPEADSLAILLRGVHLRACCLRYGYRFWVSLGWPLHPSSILRGADDGLRSICQGFRSKNAKAKIIQSQGGEVERETGNKNSSRHASRGMNKVGPIILLRQKV